MIYIFFLLISILSLMLLSRFLFFLSDDSLYILDYKYAWLVMLTYINKNSVKAELPISKYIMKPTFNNVELCVYFSLRFCTSWAMTYRKRQPMYCKFELEHYLYLFYSLVVPKSRYKNPKLFNDSNVFVECNCFTWLVIYIIIVYIIDFLLPIVLHMLWQNIIGGTAY